MDIGMIIAVIANVLLKVVLGNSDASHFAILVGSISPGRE